MYMYIIDTVSTVYTDTEADVHAYYTYMYMLLNESKSSRKLLAVLLDVMRCYGYSTIEAWS